MRYTTLLLSLFWLTARSTELLRGAAELNTQAAPASLFEAKLDKRVKQFDAAGRPFVAVLLDLAYEQELPIGIEYIDRDAVTQPIHLELRGQSVRGILTAVVQQAPNYRLSLANGLVDVYAPKARDDPSNLLNRTIKDFAISGADTHDADLELACVLAREVSRRACVGSVALGQWGQMKISLHMQNAKVYEILNAIIAQNGRAVWTVLKPPEKLSTEVGDLWHIYPIDPPFKDVVLAKLSSISR